MEQGTALLAEQGDPSNGGSTITAARDFERGLTDTSGQGKYPDGPPMTKLGDDEPWFFLRAQDRLAPGAVHEYACLLEAHGLDHAAADVRDFAVRMEEWQAAHADRVKLPD